jgi:hypothetical protein
MAAWLVEVGIISVRDFVGSKRPPLPSELLATFVVFGGLGLVGESQTWKGAAGATAWGIVLATLLSSRVDFLKPVGDFFAGTAGTGATSGPAPNVVGAAPSARPVTNQGGSLLNAQKGL